MSDNGSEFKSPKIDTHPFERLLHEMNIKHSYTKAYRPQTNGKIERFWKTLEEDVFFENIFSSIEDLRKELNQYLYYYNYERPHQGIDNKAPGVYLKLSVN